MERPSWAAQYVGIPFRVKGRGHEGADCWGLARLVLQEQFGKTLPSFDKAYEDLRDPGLLAALVDVGKPLVGAHETTAPSAGTIVLMQCQGVVMHVGVMVSDTEVLHIERGCDAVIENAFGPRIAPRCKGFFDVY